MTIVYNIWNHRNNAIFKESKEDGVLGIKVLAQVLTTKMQNENKGTHTDNRQ